MKSLSFLALVLAFSFPLEGVLADNSASISDEASPVPEAASTPQPTPTSETKSNRSPQADQALIIHKPMPSASWGKVIQYRREEIFPLSDNNRETLYEFVFQDDKGIVRTAVYHETPSGEGYWEVTVWDLP